MSETRKQEPRLEDPFNTLPDVDELLATLKRAIKLKKALAEAVYGPQKPKRGRA